MTLTRTELWRPNGLATALVRRARPDRPLRFTGAPSAANTGLNVNGLSTADLTVINGDLQVDNTYRANNGPVVSRLWVKGHVLMTATTGPVTIQDSLIEGRTFTGGAPWEAIIRARRGDAPTTATINFSNCKITCVQPDVGISSAAGERLGRFYRCDISLGSDLLDYWAPAVPNVEASYLHDYSFWQNDSKHTNDSQHPGWSHNDLIQNSGSAGGYVYGNTFDCRAADGVADVATLKAWAPDRNYGACVMLTPGSGHITGMEIAKNYFRYGEVHVAMPNQNLQYDNANSWSVHDNFHNDRAHGYGPYSGNYSRQFIRWGYAEGPQPADVHDNLFLSETSVSNQALAGQLLPDPVLVGGAVASGQYIVSVNNPAAG